MARLPATYDVYLVTIGTDSHQPCVKIVLGIYAQLLKTAGLDDNSSRKNLMGGIHPPPCAPER